MQKSERLITILKQFGLEEREAKVYLAVLKCGIAAVAMIAKESDYKRTTAYDILDGLKAKGWVYITFIGRRQRWAARDPKQILGNLKIQINKFESFIPNLEVIKAQIPKARIQFFEGTEGIKTAFGSLVPKFTRGATYYIISSTTDWLTLDSVYFQDYIKTRARKNVKTKMIGPPTKENLVMANNTKILYSVKFLPKKVRFSGNTIIYKNYLIFSSPKEAMAILIESPELARQQKEVFNFLWQVLPDNN